MKPFETEIFFSQYEFTKPYQLASSDCESISISNLIEFGGGSIDELINLKLGYPEMSGSALLRKEISQLYSSVREDQILVLGSPIEGIYLSMRALVKMHDHVVVLSPAYDALFNVAEHISGNVTRWFLKNDGAKWYLDFDQLEDILKPETKLLVVNFPHNPTGFVPSKEDVYKIIKMAQRHNIHIFSDEIYFGLELDSKNRLLSIADQTNNSITLSGASKGLGLPGLRFGWLVIKEPKLYDRILNLKSYTSMCSNQTNEYLGLMAIRAAPQLLAKNLEIIKENIKIADLFFKKYKKNMNWLKPLGGSVSVFKIEEPSAEVFCHRVASAAGIVLLPIKCMGYEDKYVRMGFGRKDFKLNIEIFDKYLDSIL